MITGEDISVNDTVSDGFQIDKRNSDTNVRIKYKGEVFENVRTYESFYKAGEYEIEMLTPLGVSYQYHITIEDGLNLKAILPTVYENTKKKGYRESGLVDGRTVTGIESYSILKLGYGSEDTCETGMYYQTPAYGITGDTICFFLSLENEQRMKDNGWIIQSDSWGKSKSDKIYDVSTGEIGTGAVIVQTSADGKDWIRQENLGYANGLFNTDFQKNYGGRRDVLIYTPNGLDVVNGVYLRISFSYSISPKRRLARPARLASVRASSRVYQRQESTSKLGCASRSVTVTAKLSIRVSDGS